MREFICGYQTLLTCGKEMAGVVFWLLVFAAVVIFWIWSWWNTRKCRTRTPYPECCQTPYRCDQKAKCWMVPNCAEARTTPGKY